MGGAIGGFVEETIRSFGLWGVAGLMLLENLFPPIPSELVLTLAGFFVSRGALGFAGALLAATVGSLLGAFVLYGLGRLGGRPLVLRYGSLLRVKQSDLDRADGWFHRHGGWVVFLGRLLPGVRSLVSIPAGVSEMPLGHSTLERAADRGGLVSRRELAAGGGPRGLGFQRGARRRACGGGWPGGPLVAAQKGPRVAPRRSRASALLPTRRRVYLRVRGPVW